MIKESSREVERDKERVFFKFEDILKSCFTFLDTKMYKTN